MWPFSNAGKAAPFELSAEDVSGVMCALNQRNGKVRNYYAAMNGAPDTSIREPLLTVRINADPAFTDEGVRVATEQLLKETYDTCRYDYIHAVSYTSSEVEPYSTPELIYRFRDLATRYGMQGLFTRSGFDPAAWLRTTATEWREQELAEIAAKLDDRRSYLEPLLRNKRTRNKYGELDRAAYVQEIAEFMDFYFPRQALRFFYGSPPLGWVGSYVERWFKP